LNFQNQLLNKDAAFPLSRPHGREIPSDISLVPFYEIDYFFGLQVHSAAGFLHPLQTFSLIG
jgi:hypothetical protein